MAGAVSLGAPDEPEATLGAGLAAAVAELIRAAETADTLQHQLSPLLLRGGEGMEPLQSLDDLTQRLRGLGDFLAAIARDCPPGWRFDSARAAGALTLHDQKLRLILRADAPASASPRTPSGELELW